MKKSNSIYTSFFACLSACIVGFIISIILGETRAVFTLQSTLGLLASGFIYSISVLTFYAALKHSDISEFGIFTRVVVIVEFFGGIILFHEKLFPLQILGTICLIVGVIILSYKKGKLNLHKGNVYALATAVLGGIGGLIDKAIIGNFSVVIYTGLIYLVISILLLPLFFNNLRKKIQIPGSKFLTILTVASIMYTFSAMLYYKSYQIGYISLTGIVSQIQIPLVVLYGIFIFKEKEKIWQKLAATGLMIIGAYLLSI
jgi:drug/metabolite transporter (DMT)-like permease